jgi:hypothetical protein
MTHDDDYDDNSLLGYCVVLIGLMMERVRTSEMSISFYGTTRRNIPEGCHFHTRRRENLKCHLNET